MAVTNADRRCERVSTAEDLGLAVQWLRGPIFTDGYESGDTFRWGTP